MLFLCLLFASNLLSAQNINGTWEGEMNGELLRLSVEQKGMSICGFTHDYVLGNKNDNCTAAYSGKYLSEQKLWAITGTYFIFNSGSHVLMKMIFWADSELGPNYLRGKITTGGSFEYITDPGSYDVVLRRVSTKPIKLANGEPNCFPKPVRKPLPANPPVSRPAPPKPVPVAPKPKPVAPKPQPVKPTPKPLTPKPATPKPVVPAAARPPKTDTVKKPLPIAVKPTAVKPDAELLRKMTGRRQTQQSTLEVNVKQINLKVYDNGEIDNDTVSIFYNGKLLLSHQRLSDKPIIINLDLDENISRHTLTMYAENLGGIPPNTALIVVTAGDKRYELRSKASLEENAVLVFDYKPK